MAAPKPCIYCRDPTPAREEVVSRLMGVQTTHRVPVCHAAACRTLHSDVLAAKSRRAAEKDEIEISLR